MPDHQQAAVLALFEKIMGEDPTTPAPVRFALLSDEDKRVFREALAAAEPHLRKKWAEEIIDELDTARAAGKVYTYGEVQDLIREGAGE